MQSFRCLWCFFLQIEAAGGEAITFGGDVSKEADVESMMKAVSVVCMQKENIPFHFNINRYLNMIMTCFYFLNQLGSG